jgi:hypothetical protein
MTGKRLFSRKILLTRRTDLDENRVADNPQRIEPFKASRFGSRGATESWAVRRGSYLDRSS